MPFWVVSEIGPENSVLDGDAHRRHLANTVERLCDCVDLLLVVAILPLPSLLFFYIFFLLLLLYYYIMSATQGSVPSPRAAHGAAKLGRQVFVFGGRHDATRLNDLYVLDMSNFIWTR